MGYSRVSKDKESRKNPGLATAMGAKSPVFLRNAGYLLTLGHWAARDCVFAAATKTIESILVESFEFPPKTNALTPNEHPRIQLLKRGWRVKNNPLSYPKTVPRLPARA